MNEKTRKEHTHIGFYNSMIQGFECACGARGDDVNGKVVWSKICDHDLNQFLTGARRKRDYCDDCKNILRATGA